MAQDKCEGCKDAPHGEKLTYSDLCLDCCRFYPDKYEASVERLKQLEAESEKRIRDMSDNNFR